MQRMDIGIMLYCEVLSYLATARTDTAERMWLCNSLTSLIRNDTCIEAAVWTSTG